MINSISNNVVGISVMGVGADIIVGSPVLERERTTYITDWLTSREWWNYCQY